MSTLSGRFTSQNHSPRRVGNNRFVFLSLRFSVFCNNYSTESLISDEGPELRCLLMYYRVGKTQIGDRFSSGFDLSG